MKAITLVKYGPSAQAFKIRELPDPELGAGSLKIKVDYSGLNFADVMARLGLYQDAPKLPAVLGYDVVGRVVQLGSDVSKVEDPELADFKVGQRVVAFTRFGGYADTVVVNSLAATPIPEDWDGATATALATQYCTAHYAACEMVRLFPGDRVLIQAAAGGVGTALVQMAKNAGCEVFGTAGSASKVAYMKRQGVDHAINYREQDFAKECSEILKGQKLDVVFDAIGGQTVRKAYDLLGAGGRMVCFGASAMAGKKANVFRSVKTAASFGLYHPIGFLMSSRAVIGVNMLRIADQKPEVIQRCLQSVVKQVAEGKLKPELGKVFAATQIADAHDYLGLRESIGKVALKWNV